MARVECPSTPGSNADPAVAWSDPHVGVIGFRGEHDLATVSILAATPGQAVAAEGGDVAVDLRAVDFMDASTIVVIIAARNLLARQSRALPARLPSLFAQRLLDVCGLANLLDPRPVATDPAPAMVASALSTWVGCAATPPLQRLDDAEASADLRAR